MNLRQARIWYGRHIWVSWIYGTGHGVHACLELQSSPFLMQNSSFLIQISSFLIHNSSFLNPKFITFTHSRRVDGAHDLFVFCAKFISFSTKIIVFSAKYISFSTKIIVFSAKFISFRSKKLIVFSAKFIVFSTNAPVIP